MKIFPIFFLIVFMVAFACANSSDSEKSNEKKSDEKSSETSERCSGANSSEESTTVADPDNGTGASISLNEQTSTALNGQNNASTAPSSPAKGTSTPNSTIPAATTTLSPAVALQYVTPVSEEDKVAAVQCHNNYRSQLALGNVFNKTGGNKMPTANSMRKFKWDDNLAKLAAEWANKCTISHSNNGWAGENLYMNGGTFTNKDAFTLACDAWWSELAQVGFYSDLVLRRATFGAIGHWSQMAWANTFGIGCAVAKNCPNTNWKSYVVCWYYEGGNYMDSPVYSAGLPCSKCNAGDKCDPAEGLCYQ